MKVFFITGGLLYNSMVVERIINTEGVEVKGVMVGDFIYPRISYVKGALLVIKKAGIKYFIFKAFETLMLKCLVVIKGKKRKLHLMEQLPGIYNVPVIKIKDVNSPEVINYIRNLTPDLIISMIPQKIGKELMSVSKKGIINLHPGLLPEYRAFGGYFWPMVDGFGYFGYTIHFIDEGIDTGAIIRRQAFNIGKLATVQNLYYYAFKHGAEGLGKVLETYLKEKEFLFHKQENPEKYPCRPWPDGRAIRLLKKKGYRLFRMRDLLRLYRNDF